MSQSNLTPKFFRPSHRTVSCHNGLLNTKTKHITAEDRFVVAERRQIDTEHRRSTGYLQNLSHEQKLLERRNSISKQRSSSTGAVASLARSSSWNDGIAQINQNHLLIPKIDDFCRRSSASSDGGETIESLDDDEHQRKTSSHLNIVHPPSGAVICPEGDVSFFLT